MTLQNRSRKFHAVAAAILAALILVLTACASPANVRLQGSGGGLASSAPTNLKSYMTNLLVDVAQDWQTRFEKAGLTFTPIQYDWVEGTDLVNAGINGDCGIAGDPDYGDLEADPAFACPSDLTVYLSVDWMHDNIWNAGGAMAVGVVVAHEVFHLIQDERGITDPVGSKTVAPTELQADCAAGVWANDKYYSGQLEGGDINIAANLMASVGDNEFDDPGHHGTPDQRRAAFMLGYNQGNIDSCTLNLPQQLPEHSS